MVVGYREEGKRGLLIGSWRWRVEREGREREVYLEAEDLRLHETEGFAVDFDETFARLEKTCQYSIGGPLLIVFVVYDAMSCKRTLQCATAVAEGSVSLCFCIFAQEQLAHTSLFLAEALNTLRGSHAGSMTLRSSGRCFGRCNCC